MKPHEEMAKSVAATSIDPNPPRYQIKASRTLNHGNAWTREASHGLDLGRVFLAIPFSTKVI